MKKKRRHEMTVAELVRKAAAAANAARTPEERKQLARKAAEARWKDHEYSIKQSAVSQRRHRLKLAGEQNKRNKGDTDMIRKKPIATICHNDDDARDPKHRRVVLFAGSDGFIWARMPGEEIYRTDCEVGDEASAWGDPAWDFTRIHR